MELSQITKVHFIGVGGIGVSALLRLFAAKGITISGSDIHLPPIATLPRGNYFEGADAAHISADTDLVVYSPAVPESNPERVRARELGIKEMSYPEALGMITATYNTVAISGTHGKSTTTALTGNMFAQGGMEPSVIVGAEVPGWTERNLLRGTSDIFIVEACEYRRAMMNLAPQTIVLTNLELDHPDYYRDLADVKHAFRDYIGKLSGEDLLIVNNDDANIRDIVQGFDGIIVRYGIGEGSDCYARNVREGDAGQTFDLVWKGTALGTLTTLLPGLYNIYNILAATATYLAYGGKHEAIQATLNKFHGIGRRFEELGMLGETKIISDYAHHPTALKAVADAAASRYAKDDTLIIFRPHHRERTQKLFDQFVDVIAAIPHIILVEIYDVAGREEGLNISSQDVIAKVLEKNPNADIVYAKDLAEAEEMAREKAGEFEAILVIGAGDADELARKLTSDVPSRGSLVPSL